MKPILSFFAFFSFLLLAYSCGEGPAGNDTDTGNRVSFSPDSGYVNSIVTISGLNLTDTSGIKIKFGYIQAKIIEVNENSVNVTVPNMESGYTAISVNLPDSSIVFEKRFFVKPMKSTQLTSFSPKSGYPGDKVYLYGKNFLSDSVLSVTFNNFSSTITSITDNCITVTVPFSGPLKALIHVNSKSYTLSYADTFNVYDDGKIHLTDFNSISIRIINFHVLYSQYSKWFNYPNDSGSSDTSWVLYNYSASDGVTSFFNYDFQDTSKIRYYYQIGPNWIPIFVNLYKSDVSKSIFGKVDLQCCHTRYKDANTELTTLSLFLHDVPYSITREGIAISIKGKTLSSIVDSVESSTQTSYSYSPKYHGERFEGIKQLLEYTDSSEVIIRIYKK